MKKNICLLYSLIVLLGTLSLFSCEDDPYNRIKLIYDIDDIKEKEKGVELLMTVSMQDKSYSDIAIIYYFAKMEGSDEWEAIPNIEGFWECDEQYVYKMKVLRQEESGTTQGTKEYTYKLLELISKEEKDPDTLYPPEIFGE